MLVIAHVKGVLSHTFKKNSGIERLKDVSCSIFPLSLRDVTVVLGMRQSIDNNFCFVFQKIDPELYFKDLPVLKKQDARIYEGFLKKILLDWLANEKTEAKVMPVGREGRRAQLGEMGQYHNLGILSEL